MHVKLFWAEVSPCPEQMEPWVIRLHIRICNTYTCKRSERIKWSCLHPSLQKKTSNKTTYFDKWSTPLSRQCWTPDTRNYRTYLPSMYVYMYVLYVQVQALRLYYPMYVRIQVKSTKYTHVYKYTFSGRNPWARLLFVSQLPTTHLRNDQSVFALAVDRRSASLDERKKVSPVTAGSSVR